ncbi:MAG: hypothetical protein QOH41_2679 [Blastocatellia bacterium]|nr:hypothetical protein [Blastocatellia bacterium]
MMMSVEESLTLCFLSVDPLAWHGLNKNKRRKPKPSPFLRVAIRSVSLIANYDGLGKTVIDRAAVRVNHCIDHSQTK